MKPNRRTTELAAGLFRSRGKDLLAFLRRRLRSDADANDIAQETYLRFIRLADPDRIDNPEAYLFRVATNLMWEHTLRQSKTPPPAEPESEPVAEHMPLDLAIAHQIGQRIKAALSELPPTPRAVLILHLRDGLTHGQIGTQIGVSESMAKKHFYAAVAQCRKSLCDLEP